MGDVGRRQDLSLVNTRGHMSPIAISPASYYHCDAILIMTSFVSELATPSLTDERMYVRTPYGV